MNGGFSILSTLLPQLGCRPWPATVRLAVPSQDTVSRAQRTNTTPAGRLQPLSVTKGCGTDNSAVTLDEGHVAENIVCCAIVALEDPKRTTELSLPTTVEKQSESIGRWIA